MIRILGTIRGVNLKSKVGEDGRTVHNITLSLELTEGIGRVQEIVGLLKQICNIEIDSRQPHLEGLQ